MALSFVLCGLSANSAGGESGSATLPLPEVPQPPVVVITPPNKHESFEAGSVLPVSGTCYAEGGIAAIYCGSAPAPNGNFNWSLAATNSSDTWTGSVVVLLGRTVVAAYAVDFLGHASKTNFITIEGVEILYPPLALNGLACQMATSNGGNYEMTFGASTFIQQSADTNYPPGAGIYTYAVTSTRTAQLYLSYLGPAEMAGTTNVLDLTFPEPYHATFAGTSQDTGSAAFDTATNIAPESISDLTLEIGGSNKVVYSEGLFTNIAAGQPGNAGYYTYARFGPSGGLVSMHSDDSHYAGDLEDVVLTFSSKKAGRFFSSAFDATGKETGVGAGSFAAVYRAPGVAGFAPGSLSGIRLIFMPNNELPPAGKNTYKVEFGDAIFGVISLNTNNTTGVGTYSYLRSAPNNAQVIFKYAYPQSQAGLSGTWDLEFSAARSGRFFNTNGFEAGKFTLNRMSAIVPPTLIGKAAALGSRAKGSSYFFGLGTVSVTLAGIADGTVGYSYLPIGDQVALIALESTNLLLTPPTCLQLNFSTRVSGNAIIYEGHNKSVSGFTLK